MNLPVALGLWLANSGLAALFGYWLGRTAAKRQVRALPVLEDDPAEVLEDIGSDAARADEDLQTALADLNGPADAQIDAWSAAIEGHVERLLRSTRSFERRLTRSYSRLARLATAAGGVWPALAAEVLSHRDRVGEFCNLLQRELSATGGPAGMSAVEIVTALRAFAERNRLLRQELDQVKHRLVERETSLFEAERDARVDPLTRLPNRRAFGERLAACQARADRGLEPYTLVLFDLDRFKDLNDERGHLFGDAVLSVFGRILSETVRASDHAARYGGEEFAVLLPGADAAAAGAVAERCRRHAEKSVVRRGDVKQSFTVSGGVAAWVPGRTADEILSAADRALYAAKAAGRNCIRIETAELTAVEETASLAMAEP